MTRYRTYTIALLSLFLNVIAISPARAQDHQPVKISDSLSIVQLTANAWLHVSNQTSAQFGKFTSNGLIFVKNKEAIVMDTPPSIAQTRQLLEWFHVQFPDVSIKAIVVNHFHSDALGGLSIFHKNGVESYAHALTPTLLEMKRDTFAVPRNTFQDELVLEAGGSKVISYYPGEAHTRDNIVTWVADEKILFGGCMVKTMNAGKGNLADANLAEWSNTIARVRKKFGNAKIVIPGHGIHGGLELLDYTIKLFR